MGIAELFLLASGLAMDAFSVSVCKGLSMKKKDYSASVIIALFFGIFQGIMPLIGYFVGSRFGGVISGFSHWIAFFLLGIIGIKMIAETLHSAESNGDTSEFRLDFKELIILAIATSIDALAVGVVFAAIETDLLISVSIIGGVTFAFCLFGVVIGNKFGSKYERKAGIAGGIILILIGVKFLLDAA